MHFSCGFVVASLCQLTQQQMQRLWEQDIQCWSSKQWWLVGSVTQKGLVSHKGSHELGPSPVGALKVFAGQMGTGPVRSGQPAKPWDWLLCSAKLPSSSCPINTNYLNQLPNDPGLFSCLTTSSFLGFVFLYCFVCSWTCKLLGNLVLTLLLLAIILCFLPFNRISLQSSSAVWARLCSWDKPELDLGALGHRQLNIL